MTVRSFSRSAVPTNYTGSAKLMRSSKKKLALKTSHYIGAAMLSLGVLTGVLVNKGDEGPFGTSLQLSTTGLLSTAESYDQFEIIYFGAPDCLECTTWRKGHLPLWERHIMSTQVQLTLKTANCRDTDAYASACTATFETTDKLPGFALVDHATGEVMSTGTGIDGFYDLVRKTGDVLDESEAGSTGV